MFNERDYPIATDARNMTQRLSVQESLKLRRVKCEEELADLTKSIELLESQPQLLETLNLLRKVGI